MPVYVAPSTVLVALAAIALLLVALARMAGHQRGGGASYRRKAVLTAWERKALAVPNSQIRPGMHLCPQVRLADVLSIDAGDRSSHIRALNKVACKSVDFVVVDVASGNPLLVIELDDKTHRREDRQARDAFVDDVLRKAGIPILRFKPSQRLEIAPHLTPTFG